MIATRDHSDIWNMTLGPVTTARPDAAACPMPHTTHVGAAWMATGARWRIRGRAWMKGGGSQRPRIIVTSLDGAEGHRSTLARQLACTGAGQGSAGYVGRPYSSLLSLPRLMLACLRLPKRTRDPYRMVERTGRACAAASVDARDAARLRVACRRVARMSPRSRVSGGHRADLWSCEPHVLRISR